MWFKRKEDDGSIIRLHNNLRMAFSRVNEDISQIKGWASNIHSKQQNIENMHKNHVSLTKKDIDHLNEWIKFLHQNSAELHKYFKEATVNLIELHKKDQELHNKILHLEREIEALKASSQGPVRTKSEPKSGLKSEPVVPSRNRFETRVLEAVRPNRKSYIMDQIMKVDMGGEYSTKQLEKIIVFEKKLCGRTAFYDYLKELRIKKKLKKKVEIEREEKEE